jgi:hypothetical protein
VGTTTSTTTIWYASSYTTPPGPHDPQGPAYDTVGGQDLQIAVDPFDHFTAADLNQAAAPGCTPESWTEGPG